jgi:hypothetical protein
MVQAVDPQEFGEPLHAWKSKVSLGRRPAACHYHARDQESDEPFRAKHWCHIGTRHITVGKRECTLSAGVHERARLMADER